MIKHGKAFLTGEDITIADFALFSCWKLTIMECALKHQIFCKAITAVINTHPKLKTWVKLMEVTLHNYFNAGYK